jgi:two-component system response regulator YcbB
MQTLINNQFPGMQGKNSTEETEKEYTVKLKRILQRLGIMTEKGSRDIITLVTYLVENKEEMEELTLHQLCKFFSDNPKSMEQRVRRTANVGMVNLANLGLEDYSNEIFVNYANSLYNFEQVRREMDFIRGKTDKHGNVKIKNFLNALVHVCKTT